MNYNLFHNTSCLGDAYFLQTSLNIPYRYHKKQNLSNISLIKQ